MWDISHYILLAILSRFSLSLEPPFPWTPSQKPVIVDLDIDNTLGNESFTEHLSLHLTTAPIVRYRRIDFKRQILQAYRILDISELSLLGSQIKVHQNRFNMLTSLQVNDGFMTRKYLSREFLIKDNIEYNTCNSLCINQGATMIDNKDAYDELQQLTPRYKGMTWLYTSQNVQLDNFDAEYDVQFGNISLLTEYEKLGFNDMKIFYLNDNQSLEQIQLDEIGVSTNYWSSLNKGRYYQKTPLQLQVNFQQPQNAINMYVPIPTHSLLPRSFYARCVCSRSLLMNTKKLDQAKDILKSSLTFQHNTPQSLEFLRLKRHGPPSGSSIHSLLQNDKVASISKLISVSDIHPLLVDSIPQNLSCSAKQCTLHDDPNQSTKSQESTLTLLNHIFPQHNLDIFHRGKRAILASVGTSVFLKALTISSPYLIQSAAKPFQKLVNEFKDSKHLYEDPNMQFVNISQLNSYLKVHFSNTPLKMRYAKNKFEIVLNHQFPTITAYTTANVAFANDLKRASELLAFFKDILETEIPKIIIHSIIASLDFPLSHNPVIFDLYHSASFIVFRTYFEIIRLDQPVETTRLIALPHKQLGTNLHFYKTSNYSLDQQQLSGTESIQSSQCFNEMSSSTPTPLHACPQIQKPTNVLARLIMLKSASLFQIQGPSTVKISCEGHMSDTIKLGSDINLLLISNSCTLSLNYKALTKIFDKTSQQLSSFKFKQLLSYNLPQYNTFQQKVFFYISVLATVTALILLILCATILVCIYFKRRYKPKFLNDNLSIESPIDINPELQTVQESNELKSLETISNNEQKKNVEKTIVPTRRIP